MSRRPILIARNRQKARKMYNIRKIVSTATATVIDFGDGLAGCRKQYLELKVGPPARRAQTLREMLQEGQIGSKSAPSVFCPH